jgi:Ran GTPase-activating protein (RanGAP) involved in mRNA processing and transport
MDPDFWFQYPGPGPAKWATVLNALGAITARARVTRLHLFSTAQLHGLPEVLARCDLRRFSLHSNGNTGAQGAAVLARALRTATDLTHLNLRRNDVRVGGMQHLAPTLATLDDLQHLDLGLNALDDRGVTALAPALVLCTALHTLCLSGNQCRAGGAIALAAFVARYSALTHLDVGRNNLETLGAEHLAAGLARCPRLAHLDFSNNRFCLCPSLLLPALTRAHTC